MINIFKRHAPAYKRLVRRFALSVWDGDPDRDEFFERADRYRRKYESDLIDYYRNRRIRIFPGTIREKGRQWLIDQGALADTIEVLASAKKNDLTNELFAKVRETQSADVKKLLSQVLLSEADRRRGAEVYKVFSFGDNLGRKAEQLGEQQAFELGADINHDVVASLGDTYDWNTQEDSRVRATHRKLNKKTFAYVDHPTTVDKAGHTHQGPPGSDYGCRCWESPGTGKPRKNYVARA